MFTAPSIDCLQRKCNWRMLVCERTPVWLNPYPEDQGSSHHSAGNSHTWKLAKFTSRLVPSVPSLMPRTEAPKSGAHVKLSCLGCCQIFDHEFHKAACIAMKLKHYKSATKDFIVNMKRETPEELSKMEREGTRFSAVVDKWTSNQNMQV